MRMHVDEAGRHRAAASVDDAGGGGIAEPPHVHDPPAADADVGRDPGVAAAVEDAAVADQDVVARRRLCERRGAEREQNEHAKDESCGHGVILAQTRLGWRKQRTRTLGGTSPRQRRTDARHPARRLADALPIRSCRTAGRCPLRPSWRASRRWSFRRRGPTCGSVRIRAATCRPPAATRAAASSTGITPRFRQMRDEAKYGRLPAFAQALPPHPPAHRGRRAQARPAAREGAGRRGPAAREDADPHRQRGVRARQRLGRADDDARSAREGSRRGRPLRVPRQERHRARRRSARRAAGAHRQGVPRSARATSCFSTSTKHGERQTICSDDVNAYLRRDQRRRFHRQGFPHLGRHRAGGAGAGAAGAVQVADRGEAQRRAGDRGGRQAAGQHQGRSAGSATSIRRSSPPTWTASRWRPTKRVSPR